MIESVMYMYDGLTLRDPELQKLHGILNWSQNLTRKAANHSHKRISVR